MHQTAELMAITNDGLAKASTSIQEYVKEFFRRTNVLGKDCWVAFLGSLDMGYNSRNHQNGGVAKSNWQRGLREEMKGFFEANPAECFSFYASWDDGCIGPDPD